MFIKHGHGAAAARSCRRGARKCILSRIGSRARAHHGKHRGQVHFGVAVMLRLLLVRRIPAVRAVCPPPVGRRRAARRGPMATARAFSPPLLLREFFGGGGGGGGTFGSPAVVSCCWRRQRARAAASRRPRASTGHSPQRAEQPLTSPPPTSSAASNKPLGRSSPVTTRAASRNALLHPRGKPPVSSASLLGGCARGGEGCAGRKKWDTAGSLSTSPSLSTFTGRLTKTISMLGGQCLPLRRTVTGVRRLGAPSCGRAKASLK